MKNLDLNNLFNEKYIDSLGFAFGRLIQRLSGQADPWVALAAALVTRAGADGHVCLDLSRTVEEGILSADGQESLAPGTSAAQWRAHLSKCSAVGQPGEFKPLILNGSRLYLHRFWQYERELAEGLRRRCRAAAGLKIDSHKREEALARFFPDAPEQKAAARLVLTRPFCVISGGPGTGKTYTLAQIIVLLARLAAEHAVRIKIAAPTGKAAARLQESLQALVPTLAAGDPRPLASAAEAETVHRLLGIGPASTAHYNAEHPLPAEVVIIDEASMLDLALMVKLVRAVPERAHLVLTGDKDQLSSVDAGAVLGDICRGLIDDEGSERMPQQLSAPVALLRKSYRFADRGGIGALSRAINTGDAGRVMDLLMQDRTGEIGFVPIVSFSEAAALLAPEILEAYGPLKKLSDPQKALDQLKLFKILTAVRQGPMGVETLNAWIERFLRRRGLITPLPGMSDWYAGRPVMVTRNDYFHRLFNGDTGIVLNADRPDTSVEVAFESARGVFRRLRPHELPAHETVYAMTVHKSQGSEFERVVFLLPDRDLPLLTRELLYTAVTRARQSVLVVGDPRLLETAVRRRSERASGLREALSSENS